jgi:tyrosine-protein kinase Etk/Wzc
LFFAQQLSHEKEALAIAEAALKTAQQSTGMLVPSGQAEGMIRAGAQIRAEIVSREVQLLAMRSFATDENPRMQILEQEIIGFKSKLAGLEGSGGSNSSLEFSAGRFPGANLEYIRKVRDLKYHETLFELIAKQHEAARIDEAKQPPIIQVVDRAVVPDRKAWPPRMLFTMTGGGIGFVLACAWALISAAIRNLAQLPENARQMQSLKGALRF